MKAAAGTPWLWTLGFRHHEDRAPTDGYEATREATRVGLQPSDRERERGGAGHAAPPKHRAAVNFCRAEADAERGGDLRARPALNQKVEALPLPWR